jgi:hypothetical protein
LAPGLRIYSKNSGTVMPICSAYRAATDAMAFRAIACSSRWRLREMPSFFANCSEVSESGATTTGVRRRLQNNMHGKSVEEARDRFELRVELRQNLLPLFQ